MICKMNAFLHHDDDASLRSTWMHSSVGAIGAWIHKPPDFSLITVMRIFVVTFPNARACSCSSIHISPFSTCHKPPRPQPMIVINTARTKIRRTSHTHSSHNLQQSSSDSLVFENPNSHNHLQDGPAEFYALGDCSRNPAPGAKQTGEELQLQHEMRLWICFEQRWLPSQRPQLLLHKTHKLDMVKKTATMRKKEESSVTSFRMVRLSRNGPNGNGKPVMLK